MLTDDDVPMPSHLSHFVATFFFQGGAKSAKDVLRELYAGVDLPKLVQRMLVVMHEVRGTDRTVVSY